MSLDDALAQGDYQHAVELLDAELRESADAGKLFMAVELKCFLQDFDGAMCDLERLAETLSDEALLEEFRPVITNARLWCDRQTIANSGSQRASVGGLPDYSMLFDDALHFHAAGDHAQAAIQLDQAKADVPPAGGELTFGDGDTISFRDLWDADDLTGPHLVCSHPQALLDIPFSQISELEFLAPRGFQDTLWKPCIVKTWTGDEAFVRVFSYYVNTGNHQSEYIRQLRMTRCKHETGYAIAFGQRDWQFKSTEDDDIVHLVGIHRVERIAFAAADHG